jgi:hypothetical protein
VVTDKNKRGLIKMWVFKESRREKVVLVCYAVAEKDMAAPLLGTTRK